MRFVFPGALTALISLAFSVAFAAATVPAISFYRSPQSLFASGQTSQKNLLKNWVKDSFQFTFLVNKDHRQFWVEADKVARDFDLSARVRLTSGDLKPYQVIDWRGNAVLVEDFKTHERKMLDLSAVQPDPADLGLAMTLIETQVRTSPSWKSDSFVTVPAKTRLRLLSVKDSWAQVALMDSHMDSHMDSPADDNISLGYVDISNLLLKMDFASFVLIKGEWQPFHHRDGDRIFISDSRSVAWQEVQGVLTKSHLGVSLCVDDSRHLLIRQNLEILKTQPQTWKISQMPGHGLVYWMLPQSSARAENLTAEGSLTTDELLRREITSVAFHPQNPKFGLASAGGIYLTKDGEHWQRLSQFQSDNHVVSIDSKGRIYVGALRSENQGKSFEPYFRWETLASVIAGHLKSPSHELRLDSISFAKKNILQIEVSNGSQTLRLAARNEGSTITHWDVN
jgi:hypothetical protein